MVAFFLIIAALAGLCLLPARYTGMLGLKLPDTPRMRRLCLGVMFAALTIACLYMKIIPLALIMALVGGAVVGMNKLRERLLENEDLREEGGAKARTEQREWRPPARGAMAPEEACAVLGLKRDASAEEIDAAWRRLIAQNHPDKGGTDYLAAKLNEARSVLKRRIE